jgi:hypothetical protein
VIYLSYSAVPNEIYLRYSCSSKHDIFEYSGSSEQVIVEFQELTNCEQCSVKKELPAQNLQLYIVKL